MDTQAGTDIRSDSMWRRAVGCIYQACAHFPQSEVRHLEDILAIMHAAIAVEKKGTRSHPMGSPRRVKSAGHQMSFCEAMVEAFKENAALLPQQNGARGTGRVPSVHASSVHAPPVHTFSSKAYPVEERVEEEAEGGSSGIGGSSGSGSGSSVSGSGSNGSGGRRHVESDDEKEARYAASIVTDTYCIVMSICRAVSHQLVTARSFVVALIAVIHLCLCARCCALLPYRTKN
jgi:hypothetical protein